MELRIEAGAAGFEQTRSQWDELALALGDTWLIQQSGWWQNLLASFAADADAYRWVTAYESGHVCAVLPVHLQAARLARLPVRAMGIETFGLIGDALAARPELLADVLVQAMAELHIDTFAGYGVRVGTALARSSLARRPAAPVAVIPARSHADLVADLSKNQRHNLRRTRRRLGEMGEVTFAYVDESAQLVPALQRFVSLEAAGWKGSAGTAIASNPRHLAFYEGLAGWLGADRRFVVSLLELDGEPLAGGIGFRDRGKLFLCKIAYDEQHANLGPVHLLLEDMLRLGRGDAIDFLGTPDWARPWKPVFEPTWDVHVHGSLKARAAGAVRGLARRWIGVVSGQDDAA